MAKKATETPQLQDQESSSTSTNKYTVVARRYRPKTFSELVGQSTVAQALLTAIQSNRVGHAYLFTGARGVGKTSTARIFAKALNASANSSGQFDPNSEIALAIDSGEDMDVLEIDGASNRGIDEIRQLRANAAIRPSRSKYKIYIIDEVHMLTTQAFNALLKTLEEPPGHVKFIFCTTDPEKIPITVLSRCQRFDFPPVSTEQIFERLEFICQQEGSTAEDAALRLIARRASGSMRDSQSLLEQLLSFGGNIITTQSVHDMLGIADETRLASFVARLMERDAAGAMYELDSAISDGVDVGQLADQLLGYLRDIMLVSVGGNAELTRTANPNNAEQLAQWGKAWGTMTLLSSMQILDEAMVKMRHSTQSRVLMEIALVQICNLQDLQSLSELIKAFSTGSPAPPPRVSLPSASPEAKKKLDAVIEPSIVSLATPTSIPNSYTPNAKSEPLVPTLPSDSSIANIETGHKPDALHAIGSVGVEPASAERIRDVEAAAPALTERAADNIAAGSNTEQPSQIGLLKIFCEVADSMGGFAKQCAEHCVRVETPNESTWKIMLTQDAGPIRDYFLLGNNSSRLAQSLQQRVHRRVVLVFELTDQPLGRQGQPKQGNDRTLVEASTQTRGSSQPQLIREAMSNALVMKFVEVFGGEVIRVDPANHSVPASHMSTVPATDNATNRADSDA